MQPVIRGGRIDPNIAATLEQIATRVRTSKLRFQEALLALATDVKLAFDECQKPDAPTWESWCVIADIDLASARALLQIGTNNLQMSRVLAALGPNVPGTLGGYIALLSAPEKVVNAVAVGAIPATREAITLASERSRLIEDERERLSRLPQSPLVQRQLANVVQNAEWRQSNIDVTEDAERAVGRLVRTAIPQDQLALALTPDEWAAQLALSNLLAEALQRVNQLLQMRPH
jgi:hypothetical protein